MSDSENNLRVPSDGPSKKLTNESVGRKERFSQIMKKFGLSPAGMGRVVGAGRQTSSNWTNLGSAPGEKYLKALKDKLRISQAWLLYGDGPMFCEDSEAGVLRESSASVAIVGWDMAYRIPLLSVEEADSYPDICNVQSMWPTIHRVGPGSFALLVSDDTMKSRDGVAPTIPEGSVVTVNVAIAPSSGAIMVLKCPNTLPAIRKLVETPNGRYLKPLNDKYESIREPAGTIYLGKIVNSEHSL